MCYKHPSFQVITAVIMIGISGSCMAATQGQNHQHIAAKAQRQPIGNIEQIQKNLSQINLILEKVLGKDARKKIRLANLRALFAGGKDLMDRIQLTLNKSIYDFTAADMENLKLLSQAINVNQPIVIKRLLRSTSAEFPAATKQQLNSALTHILSFSTVVLAKPSRDSQRQTSLPPPAEAEGRKSPLPGNVRKSASHQINDLSNKILMQPIIFEHLSFDYHGRTVNQLTPAAMCVVDLDFFKQTGGGETALMRNVGTLKLLLLASAQILKGIQVHQASEIEKEKIADLLLNDELRYFPAADRALTNEKINKIYDSVRGRILAKVAPQVSCQAVRKKFGLD